MVRRFLLQNQPSYRTWSRAQRGETEVVPRLRALLDLNPGLWQQVGDLAAPAQELWPHLIAGRNLMLLESLRRKLGDLRQELLGASPTPRERLLAERVVACWLQVHYADAAYARAPASAGKDARAELMRRQESAHVGI